MEERAEGGLWQAGPVGLAEVQMKLNDVLAKNWSCGCALGLKTAIRFLMICLMERKALPDWVCTYLLRREFSSNRPINSARRIRGLG